METPRRHPWKRRALALGLLASLTLGCGCEQRVVGVKNRWVGGSAKVESRRAPEPRKSFLKSTGDFLFGWTRVFAGDDKKKKPESPRYGGDTFSQPPASAAPPPASAP